MRYRCAPHQPWWSPSLGVATLLTLPTFGPTKAATFARLRVTCRVQSFMRETWLCATVKTCIRRSTKHPQSCNKEAEHCASQVLLLLLLLMLLLLRLLLLLYSCCYWYFIAVMVTYRTRCPAAMTWNVMCILLWWLSLLLSLSRVITCDSCDCCRCYSFLCSFVCAVACVTAFPLDHCVLVVVLAVFIIVFLFASTCLHIIGFINCFSLFFFLLLLVLFFLLHILLLAQMLVLLSFKWCWFWSCCCGCGDTCLLIVGIRCCCLVRHLCCCCWWWWWGSCWSLRSRGSRW